MKIKRRITLIQEIQWNTAEEAKVLKQFKKRWWVDRMSDAKVYTQTNENWKFRFE